MHLTEEDLILHFYGESHAGISRGRGEHAGRIARHLEECADCAALYEEIAGTLALVPDPQVPNRSEDYGTDVWQKIRFRLPVQERVQRFPRLFWPRLAMTAAAAALLIAAFTAGRFWPGTPEAPHAQGPSATAAAITLDAGERARLAAIADHLEQSERVLLDVVHAEGSPDQTTGPAVINVSRQQVWADALVDANRLYRDAASRAGDEETAALLDDLERSMLDIVHGPSTLTRAQLETMLGRLDAATLLFKVRVLADELHERELNDVRIRG
jgi:hypothetical protein